jgi:DNA-binding CsgD family transcriptional regulator
LVAAPDIKLRFHNVSAWVAMTFGDLDAFRREHAAWIEAARAMPAATAIASAHYNGAMCFSIFGLHDEALENVASALQIARAERNRHAETSAHAISAMCYVMRGDLEKARAALDAVPANAESQVTAVLGMGWGTLAGAYLDDQAMVAKWFDAFEATVSPAGETEFAAGFAEIMVRRGRDRDAAALLQRAIPDCECPRGMVFMLLAVARYGAPSDRARARAHLVRAADARVEVAERPALSLFDAIACARDDRAGEAAALARDAAEGFRRLRLPLLEAAALETAGDCDSALAIYRRCGALYDVRRLEALRSAERLEVPSDIADPTFALSVREREVATLAARGRTNLEIARELSISYKTVEKHLGAAYQKLGVTSRTQLAPLVSANGTR